ncbi:hypothetical protein [Mycobacterium sp.]|uniref:hypothetical protein n=1 Tax=Mycobacterium sp. TaxID=1785 RepID=UPI003C73304A
MAAAQGCGNKTWTTRVIAFGVVILGIFRSIVLSRRRFGGNVFALVIGRSGPAPPRRLGRVTADHH